VGERDLYVGLDLGTSAVKGVLVDAEGGTLAQEERPLALETPGPLAAEQDPEAWWSASRDVLRALAARGGDRVAAIGLSGQKHAFLPLDASRRPLSRAVLWCDGRAEEEAEEAHRRVPRAALARHTGAHAMPGTLVPKWLRFRRGDPAAAARVAHLVFAKDWLRLRLTGELATDRTEASASLLYDVGRKQWSETLCAAFDVSRAWLPSVRRSADLAGRVSVEGAAATGLRAGTPLVGGAGDNEAAALGCGAVGEGRVAVVLGTSGTVIAWHGRRGAAGGLVWGRHATRRGYAATGVVLSAGRALEWVARATFPRDFALDEVVAAAQASDPNEGPLVFVPSLAGERSPVPDPGASGAFVGLRPGHGRGHLARAVMEGVALSIAEVVRLLRGAGISPRELRLTSGGARSPFWRGLVAAAAGLPVRTVGDAFGPALGAAMLAARGAGRFSTLAAAAEAWVPEGEVETPEPAEVARLAALATTLRAARNALRNVSPVGARGRTSGGSPSPP
jgi:xylulokinase